MPVRNRVAFDTDFIDTPDSQQHSRLKEAVMQTIVRILAVAAALAGIPPARHIAAQAADPLIGTWTLNVAKSKYSPGPAPKSETRTYVMAGEDIKATLTGVDAD